jgi:hypothetical protein
MWTAIQDALQDYDKVIVIGTDCPDYTCEYIEQAINLLDETDVVIGPAMDGGYVLIGMKKAYEFLFYDIPWSSNAVLETTIEKIKNHSLSYALLPSLRDIDTPDDLQYVK